MQEDRQADRETAVSGENVKKSGPAQKILSAVGILLCVLFIPIIIVNVVMIVRSYTQPDRMPSVFGYSPVIVLSGSMSPEFEAGDMIIIQETDPKSLQAGDVICYMENEVAITHRIMEVQEVEGYTVFVTRGDANNVEDGTPVVDMDVVGKYFGVRLPGVGDFAMFLQSTPGMLLFIGGPVLLFVLWDIIRRALSGRKQKADEDSRRQEMEAMEQELQQLRAQAEAGKETPGAKENEAGGENPPADGPDGEAP